MAMVLLDTQEFGIGIYRGSERVGKIRFHIGIRAAEGGGLVLRCRLGTPEVSPDRSGKEAQLAVAGFDA